MRGFIVNTIITAVAFYVLTKFAPLSQFVSYDGELTGLLALAVIFGVVNGLIGPVVRILAFPLNLMTMGLIGFEMSGVRPPAPGVGQAEKDDIRALLTQVGVI